jgi:ubiquinone/menaquinone biosynthesis C-methylase UbiE
VGDVQQLPWEDGAFDAALGVHTLYFWRDVGAALTEIRRALRPGGRLALGFVSADERPDPQRYPSDVYRFQTREALADALAAAGFTEIAVERIEIRPKPISIALARTPDLFTPPRTDSPPRS